jgi:hypothetical protein
MSCVAGPSIACTSWASVILRLPRVPARTLSLIIWERARAL